MSIDVQRACALLSHVLRGLLCAVLCATLPTGPARALDPQRAIGQFTHVWYENQLPQGTVLSIAQQGDGAIWLATYGGLVRHSGAGFDAIDPRSAPALKSSAITAVSADGTSGIWVGTLNGGLYRQRGRTLEPVPLPEGIESVFGIVTDTAGALWLTTNAGVVRIVGGEPRLLGDADGFPPRGFYRAIVAAPDGGVWIAADGVGVVHWQDQRVEVYDEKQGLPSNAVYSLAIDAAGTAWVGTQAGPAFFRDGRFHREPRAAALDGRRIYHLFGDREGTVWFAPLDMGLCRLTAERFTCNERLAGMHGETVRSMFEDREGNLWIGTTSSGLHRLSQSKLVTVTGQMASNAVRAVHQVPGGDLWIGTDGGGLARYRDQALEPAVGYNAQLPSQLVRAIVSDAQGRLWVGGTEGVTRFDGDGKARNLGIGDGLPGTIVFAFAPAREGGMWTGTLQGVARIEGDEVHVVEGSRGDDTRALYEDPDGRLWIGLRSGLRCLHAGVLDRCGTDGLPGTSVFAFHPTPEGDLWLGTSVGIVRIRDGVVTRYLERAGFHGDAVFALLDDGRGNFWFSSNRGIGRIAKADLQALDDGSKPQVEPRWFGTADGMLNAQGNGASQTPAARSDDGRLWFGTAKGVVVVDLDSMQGNPQPPPVTVERMLVDGVDVDPLDPGRLGPGVERLELQFAAMSYVAPSAVRYRYRLEGFDRGWNQAGSLRTAYYTNLPPGDYVFRVMASNNDGVWNQDGASVQFTLLPLWHQTWWLRLLVVLAGLGAIAALVRLRLRAARRRELSLTREVTQRTDALREANAQLRRLAAIDALTGIANRGEFNRRLLQAWDDHARRDAPLAVLLADVDDFKAYNDSYGHLGGDDALGTVASTLAAKVRGATDLAARYGGEEFALLLPDCDPDAALALANALVAAVQELSIPHRASTVAGRLSISIGAASVRPARGGTPDDLLHAADEALYRAKAEGRNRALPA
ncbi:ligand-binding sensor domain-containing diguanylate cyclase [Pseudoxanthomonas daejeonensis]|uniref:diguanylate cyclase n=1 Tax=Pseudoxanthomonas daejeonensis TaxID=266062 RepID=A0ABQ6Z6M7_9GAMM|nr:two-component regulator propeller domain-containing protein [Pseudoxanthomonas daejeonensis]KAF1694112.1 GGDEF domain-containing protein [Pseudoxanthomonas daejeonensis]